MNQKYTSELKPDGIYCTRITHYDWDTIKQRILDLCEIRETGYGTACWLYQGSRDRDGYARVKLGQSYFRIHRLTWMMLHGEIPPHKCVCHDCDQPNCANPEHLFVGTQEENINDRHSKGRTAKGEDAGPTTLTEKDILEIRRDFTTTPARVLAAQHGVSKTHIYRIAKREWWKHLP